MALLGGMPLVLWPLLTASSSDGIDLVVCSSDSPQILETAATVPAVRCLRRPDFLASDTSSSIDVVLHVLKQLSEENCNFDRLLLLEPTSPFTQRADIDKSLRLFDDFPQATSVVTVATSVAAHPRLTFQRDPRGFINFEALAQSSRPTRRQDLDERLYMDGSLYLSYVETLLEFQSFVQPNTVPMEVDKYKNLEIDDHEDLELANTILRGGLAQPPLPLHATRSR